MQVELKVGPQVNNDGAITIQRAGKSGETIVADGHARYQEAVLRGNCYKLVVNAGAATAFTGGAGGTPFISIYNPVGSGKVGVILEIGITPRVAASAAGTVGVNLWGGVSVANTGTATAPTNMYTLQAGGSVMTGSSNAATTSTTAVALVLPVATYYWATAAASNIGTTFVDIGGSVVCAPGNLIALGGTAALTSATYDVSMIWEEVSA